MKTPVLIAHRGYAKRYPENTLIGIEAALKAGASCVEFDVQFTSDSTPVVLHDASLKRTTGFNKRICKVDDERLTTLLVNEAQQHPKKFANVVVPTLSSLVELLKAWPKVTPFVEIKQETLDTFGIEKVIKQLAETLAPIIDRSVLIAYDSLALRCGRAMGFSSIGWILKKYNDESRAFATELAPNYIFLNHTKLPKKLTTLWDGPWKWAFYEVTQPKLAMQLAAKGADYIETMAIAEMLKSAELKNRGQFGD